MQIRNSPLKQGYQALAWSFGQHLVGPVQQLVWQSVTGTLMFFPSPKALNLRISSGVIGRCISKYHCYQEMHLQIPPLSGDAHLRISSTEFFFTKNTKLPPWKKSSGTITFPCTKIYVNVTLSLNMTLGDMGEGVKKSKSDRVTLH